MRNKKDLNPIAERESMLGAAQGGVAVQKHQRAPAADFHRKNLMLQPMISAFKEPAPLVEALSRQPELAFPIRANIRARGGFSSFVLARRQIKLSGKRIILMDLNNTIAADFAYQDRYDLYLINKVLGHEHIRPGGERERFLAGLARLGSPGCIYKNHRFILPNGYVYAPNAGAVITTKDTVITDAREVREILSRYKMAGMVDFPMQVRALALRRGISYEDGVAIACEAYAEAMHSGSLFYPGFNDLLGKFFRETAGIEKIIVSDNHAKTVLGIVQWLGLGEMLYKDARLFYEAEKRLNYAAIISHLAETRKLGPHEMLVIGDSYFSDILIPLRMGIDTVHIAFNRVPLALYREHGYPALAAGTLNDAITYLLDRR